MTAGSVAPAPGPSGGTSPTAHGDVRAVARGGLASLGGAAVSAIANFALVIVVTRNLRPDLAGAFFGITSLFLIVEVVLRLGADTGSVYFIARWRALGMPERVRPGLRRALVPVAVAGIVAAVVMLAVAPWLSDLAADGSLSSTDQIRVLALLLPVAVTYDVTLAATRGFRRVRTNVVLEQLTRPLLQLGLVVAVVAVGRPGWLSAAWVLPYLVVLLFAGRALIRLCAPLGRGSGEGVTREFWTFSLPRAVAGAAQIVLQRLDIVLVAAMRGPRDAAIYTAASRFLVLGQFLQQAISAPVQPRLSESLSAGESARARGLYRISTTWIVLVGWPCFLLAATLSPEYLRVFGHHYARHSAILVVTILALSMLIATAVGVVDSVIIMAGRTSWNLWTTLLAVAVNVVIDIALIPSVGIVGAAIGWCAAILCSNLVPLFVAWRGLGMHPFGPESLLATGLAAACFGALPLVGRAPFGAAGAVGGAVLGALLYVCGVLAWRQRFDLHDLLRRKAPVR